MIIILYEFAIKDKKAITNAAIYRSKIKAIKALADLMCEKDCAFGEVLFCENNCDAISVFEMRFL